MLKGGDAYVGNATQLSYIRDSAKSDPALWAPYALVE
ncbi:hypothetical protein SAMN05444169_3970 [Bradyrhizobium erythrophlei]|jgi:hypothetical protein|uniref:Uncharacterized protein n=1 Tax=Bradyrhizobium erythrophlei TaxID=1437360 RepID=A0A1M5MF63_9BRAD|nr:hypothetical protein SAMN05444169_3970 [Bradyrhizobium erythrophlei]